MKQHSQNSKFYETFGWLGVGCILASYLVLSLGLLDSNSYIYHTLILLGSLLVAAISWRKRAMQPAMLNAIFAVLAVFALFRLMLVS